MRSIHAKWEGFANARDLGGIPIPNGHTQPGVLVRSEHPSRLTATGWGQLHEYGIRTIVSLETANLSQEDDLRANPRVVVPDELSGITTLRAPIEDGSDKEFMERWAQTGLWGTPLYFTDSLCRWPHLYAQVLDTLANVEEPVLFHCGRGHDRTGILSLLLLANAGVSASDIAADYLVSSERLDTVVPGTRFQLMQSVSAQGTTVERAIADVVESLDDVFWDSGAVSTTTRERLRTKLVPNGVTPSTS